MSTSVDDEPAWSIVFTIHVLDRFLRIIIILLLTRCGQDIQNRQHDTNVVAK